MSYLTFKIDSKKKAEFKSFAAENNVYVKDILNLLIDKYLKFQSKKTNYGVGKHGNRSKRKKSN